MNGHDLTQIGYREGPLCGHALRVAKHLMRGRSPEAFKDDLLKAFRSEGISLRFDAAGKNEGFSRR